MVATSPCHWQAVQDGKMDVVRSWLARNKQQVKFKDKHGFTPVHYAAKFNHLRILETLHQDGKAGKCGLMQYKCVVVLYMSTC